MPTSRVCQTLPSEHDLCPPIHRRRPNVQKHQTELLSESSYVPSSPVTPRLEPDHGTQFLEQCSIDLHSMPKFGRCGFQRTVSLKNVTTEAQILQNTVELCGGNYSGIFVRKDCRELNLKAGDAVVEVSVGGEDVKSFAGCTNEEVHKKIKKMSGKINVRCCTNVEEYQMLRKAMLSNVTCGDCFCVSISESNLPPQEKCLPLKRGTVFLITHTSLEDCLWQATVLNPITGSQETTGVIPSPHMFSRLTSVRPRTPSTSSCTSPFAYSEPYAFVKPFRCRKRPVILFTSHPSLSDLRNQLCSTFGYETVDKKQSPLRKEEIINGVMQYRIVHYEGTERTDAKRCSQIIETEDMIQAIQQVNTNLIFPDLKEDTLNTVVRMYTMKLHPIVIVINISGSENKTIKSLEVQSSLLPHQYYVLDLIKNPQRELTTPVQAVNDVIKQIQDGVVWVKCEKPEVPLDFKFQ